LKASQIGGRLGSRKRARRTKDTEDDDVAAPCTHSLDASYQAAAATSSGGMHEREEIPIHGCLTLKTIESKVVYCLTFSQEMLPCPRGRGQSQDTTTDLGEPRPVAPDPRMRQAPLRRQSPHHPWTQEEEATLRGMNGCSSEDEQGRAQASTADGQSWTSSACWHGRKRASLGTGSSASSQAGFARSTHALDHSAAQSKISFLP
jgi:hypothetical protein